MKIMALSFFFAAISFSVAQTSAPVIIAQPQSQIIRVGSNATFTVINTPETPLFFQWYFNDAPLGPPTSGTNFSSFTVTNASTNQSGNYSVKVSNEITNVLSSNAVLTVINQPILQPGFLVVLENNPNGPPIVVSRTPALMLLGVLSNNFIVQYSTNLADTNWTTLVSVTNCDSYSYSVWHSPIYGDPVQFYRAFFNP